MGLQDQNEIIFGRWYNLDTSNRWYFYDVQGTNGTRVRYFKEVDNREKFTRGWFEVRDEKDTIVERREITPNEKDPFLTKRTLIEAITKHLKAKRGKVADLADLAADALLRDGLGETDLGVYRKILARIGIADIEGFELKRDDFEEILVRLQSLT